jgi:hypothetical protein
MAITLGVAVVRWLAASHVLTGNGAAAVPQNTTGYVLTFLPVALLILPEVNSLAFGGLKVEMRKAQHEVSKLGDQIHQLQLQQAVAAASASSGHQIVLTDPAVAAAFLTSIRVSASEKVADTLGDEPSSAVDTFLNPENPDMNQ